MLFYFHNQTAIKGGIVCVNFPETQGLTQNGRALKCNGGNQFLPQSDFSSELLYILTPGVGGGGGGGRLQSEYEEETSFLRIKLCRERFIFSRII